MELASDAIIPLELCEVPPGFSGWPPRDREKRIRDGLGVCYRPDMLIMCYQVLQYGQLQCVREFGMHVPTPSTRLMELDGQIITAPRSNYNQESRQPDIVLFRARRSLKLAASHIREFAALQATIRRTDDCGFCEGMRSCWHLNQPRAGARETEIGPRDHCTSSQCCVR